VLRTAVCVIPLLDASIEIIEVPATAVVSAVMVNVEEPAPGAGKVALLNEPESPCGSPETDRETLPLKPALAVVETLTTFDPPTPMATDGGEVDNVKSGVEDGDTSTVMATVWVSEPLVPMMVTG
jgi:hypothetical protein